MISWLKFYFLGFFNDNYGKEAATRSLLNTFLSLVLTLFLMCGGMSAGYAASFGTHFAKAEEFRGFLYSAFATADDATRVNLKMQEGKLAADVPGGQYINTFKDGETEGYNGYMLIVDTRPANTAFDDFSLECKDANGIDISYEEYRKLPETGKQNGSVNFKYSGTALDVTAKQVEYIAYLDNVSDESSEEYNGDTASSYSGLKHKKSAGEISEEEYANGIYTLYAKSYYPSYAGVEIYGEAPTLRTYYLQAKLTEGKKNYLILLDDLCICDFTTRGGITVNFGSYYSDVKDGVISMHGMTAEEMQANTDKFIGDCFASSALFNFLVHFMNTGKFLLLLILVIIALSLIIFIMCRIFKLEYAYKFFGSVKITGAYLFYSALVSFILSIILSFVCARGTVFLISEITVAAIMGLRTVILLVAELIRNKRSKSRS